MKNISKTETRSLTIVPGAGSLKYSTPTLLIQAKYLESWGFPIGTKVQVKCSNRKLVITPEN